MHEEVTEVVVPPRIWEELWRVAIGSTLQSMASGVTVVLGSFFSHAGIALASCDSYGRCGVFRGKYGPLCLTWQSAEGPVDGGLALVKVRTSSEGLPHACRGSCSRRSTGVGGTVVGAVSGTSAQGCNSTGDDGTVTRVGGRDSGHIRCAAWRPNAGCPRVLRWSCWH